MESDDEQAIETSESAIDRISSLPTEILHNILSFVHMRSVVRMRRLSRRWRQVCESLQFICLSEQEFESWSVEKFTRFVNNLLLLRAKSDLHTFKLHWCCSRFLSFNDVMMWIAYAVKHNVKVLELNGYDLTFLPHCIFTCPTLQELNLQLGGASYGQHALPHTINLPSLRKLTLAGVEVSQLSLDQITTQSPGLEDLNLRDCAAYFNLVDSKGLKSLTLHGLKDGLDKFTVVAPHLIHFQCIGFPLENISWRERPCLERVHIESSGHTFDGQSDLTGIILHAKRVKLLTGTDVKVMLETELPTCSVFENLEFLQIGDWCLIDSLYVILRFLQLSPRLQKIILTHRKLPKAGKGAGKYALLNNEMKFQCPHLQTVIIQCSKDDAEIDTVVNAMVDNGVSLEKIQVTFYEDIIPKQKESGIFENTLNENPEWTDDSSYVGSESDNNDDDDDKKSWDEDDDFDDESQNEDNDNESGDDDEDELGDEDNGNDENEDEDDDSKMEDEDDYVDNDLPDEDNDNKSGNDDDESGDEDNDNDEIEDEDDNGNMGYKDDYIDDDLPDEDNENESGDDEEDESGDEDNDNDEIEDEDDNGNMEDEDDYIDDDLLDEDNDNESGDDYEDESGDQDNDDNEIEDDE